MFLVPTYVAPSAIHGLGVFAAAPIAKGTPIWRFDPAIDKVVPQDVVAALPEVPRRFFETYAYLSPDIPGGYVVNGDDARFLNHDDDPNTDNSGPVTLAARDIAAGEEITCDYTVCCLEERDGPLARRLEPAES
ncbi:SET domain-containing protein-lysine N-methyltransferase [Inquilinus limosus]|uniref:SET domain-containing protein n=1 Tax=Inquilinus limosus TaxID=171674 RepID=UPI003F1445FE